MTRLDEIKRKLNELEDEKASLTHELLQVERDDRYKSYLSKLVEADIAKPVSANVDSAFKDEVLRWLSPKDTTRRESTIKGWVLSVIDECPNQLTPTDLRSRFESEFGPKRVASLRQYLTKPFGLVQRVDGKLFLTSKGQRALRKLKKTERG